MDLTATFRSQSQPVREEISPPEPGLKARLRSRASRAPDAALIQRDLASCEAPPGPGIAMTGLTHAFFLANLLQAFLLRPRTADSLDLLGSYLRAPRLASAAKCSGPQSQDQRLGVIDLILGPLPRFRFGKVSPSHVLRCAKDSSLWFGPKSSGTPSKRRTSRASSRWTLSATRFVYSSMHNPTIEAD